MGDGVERGPLAWRLGSPHGIDPVVDTYPRSLPAPYKYPSSPGNT